MSDEFDPYYQWLGIPPKHQPPNYYRLLAIEEFEDNPDVIESAADQRMAHVRTYQTGARGDASQQILNEIAAARICLLDPAKKAQYDQALRERKEAAGAPPSAPQPRAVRAKRSTPSASSVPTSPGPVDEPAVVTSTGLSRLRDARRRKPLWQHLVVFTGLAVGIVALVTLVFVLRRGDDRPETKGVSVPKRTPPVVVTPSPPDVPPGKTRLETPPPVEKKEDPPPRKVEAPQKKKHEPVSPPVSEPGAHVDLLRVIDPQRDAVKNEWTLEDNKLSWRQAGSALLQIPFVPPAEYDLMITAARLRGNKGLMIGMIGSGRQFMFVLDDARGSGLHRLDGRGYYDNESNNSQKLLTVGAAAKTIICEVRRNGLRITCGEEKILDWQGDFGRTSLDRTWQVPDAKVLFVGGNAVFEITKLQLVPRQPPGKLADVPTPQEQQKAEQRIKQTFKAEFAQARTSPQQIALAQKLLEQGLADATEAAERFVLLREAKGLAIEAGSPALALIVAEQIERRFRVNARAMRTETLRQLAKATMPAAQRKELVESLIKFSREEVAADNYEVAAVFAELAFEQASRSRNVEARKQAVAWRNTVRQFHAWWNEAQAAQKVLAEKPDDPTAAAAVGLFICAVKRDWKAGLPHLAKGSDKNLRDAAQRDLGGASDPTQQVEVADAWYATAKSGQAFDAFRHRAMYYYYEAYHDLEGTAKKRVAARIASLRDALGPTLPRLNLPDGPPGGVRQFLGHAGPVRCVAFAPHRPLAWSGSDDGTIRVWDLRTGKTVQRLEGHAGGVWCLAFTSDGKRMISGGQDSHYRFWDVDSYRLLATYRYRDDPKQFVRCLSLSPDNSRAVVGGAMNSVDSLKAEQRQLARVQALRGPSGVVHALAFMPDGRHVVAGDNSGTLRVFDLESGAQEKASDATRGEMTSLAVTADGSHVLWAGRRKFSLGLWNVKANQEARSLDGHTATVRSVAIVPREPYAIDGPYGVSGGDDGTIRIWNLDEGHEAFRFPAQNTPVHSIAVSPDGRFVLSGGEDGIVRLWRLPRR